MKITILVYDGFTALDAIGPYEVLWRLPGAETRFVSPDGADKVTTDNGLLTLGTQGGLTDVESTDVLLVPGGPGTGKVGEQPAVKEALQRLNAGSKVTASVCTGSLILGAAGLLEGRKTTCHWAFLDKLTAYGAVPTPGRIVVDGKHYSAAGVSAGIDMALRLAADLSAPEVAQAVQLGIEYDPEPPFDHGSPDKANPMILEMVRGRLMSLRD